MFRLFVPICILGLLMTLVSGSAVMITSNTIWNIPLVVGVGITIVGCYILTSSLPQDMKRPRLSS